jgi:hypothetical protein
MCGPGTASALPLIFRLGRAARLADGAIEYRSATAFRRHAGRHAIGGQIPRQEVTAFTVNASGARSAAITGIAGFTGLRQPPDIAQQQSAGYLYVTELTDNRAITDIRMPRPPGRRNRNRASPTGRLVLTDDQGGSPALPN